MTEEEVITEEEESAPAEEEEAEAAAAEEEEEQEGEEQEEDAPPKKPKKSAQRRIAELTAKYRRTEREVQELRRLLSDQGRPQETPKQDAPKKPTRDQFGDEDDYIEALTDWKVDQKNHEIENKRTKETEHKKQQERREQLGKAVDDLNNKGLQDFEDYEDVVMDNPDLQVTESMAEAAAEMDNGHLVAYHLGKNPAKAQEIAAKTPYAQAVALAKLEDQLVKKNKKKTTKAPPPVNPVSGQKETAAKDPSKMTTEEWMDWRYSQINKR